MSPFSGQSIDLRLSGLKGTVVGVGVTAYPRSGPAGRIPGYRIVCIRRTGDLPALRRIAEVFCLEEQLGTPLEGFRDSAALLSHPDTRRYLSGLPPPVHLLLYQSSSGIERLAAEEGWCLLANPAALRVRAADRAFFMQLTATLELPAVPGCIVSLQRFQERPYEAWAREMGPRLAVQLPDVLQGGGRSTFFLENAEDHLRLRERIRAGAWMGKRVRRVSVRTFVEGEPSSVTGCIIGGRTRVSPLQRQVIDPPWVGVGSNGVFGGHSWGEAVWPDAVEAEARRQALEVGRVLSSMGYRGVFGLDLLVDRAGGSVFPVELNPRLTAAFPVLTQIQEARGE
ncbi:MAG: ATP-grasp domain-containing protein, partial [Deltaproteobacteria bacterium]|nr:ATP-grasp domain-containing protein [Deltaproteobacteria bacterium]